MNHAPVPQQRRPNNLTLYDAASWSLGERVDQVSDEASNPMEEKTGGRQEVRKGGLFRVNFINHRRSISQFPVAGETERRVS
jgi:hypothetical protein